MKQILFLGIILLGTTFRLIAQEDIDYTIRYHEGVRWVTGEYDADRIVIKLEYYEIKGDSTIGENRYNKLYWNNNLIALLRTDEGSVYMHVLKDETGMARELWALGYWGTLHEDFLLCTYTNQWETDTKILYTSYMKNRFEGLCKDSIQESHLDTVQLTNGKYYKKYKNWIYGMGHSERGPLGELSWDFAWEGGFCLVELYDNEELIFRTDEYVVGGLNEVEVSAPIRPLYSPKDKLLIIDSSLSEEFYSVDLLGIDGTKVLSFSASSCDLSGLLPGIYLVRICTASSCLYTSRIRVE